MNKIKALLFSVSVVFASLAHAQTINFIGLSDVHLNPFDLSPHYPEVNDDTNPFFFKRFIGSVAYISTHGKDGAILPEAELPQFIIISGDLLAHSFADKVVNNKDTTICSRDVATCALATMDTIIKVIRETQNGVFVGTPIYITLGNNDFDTGDYRINQAFLPRLAYAFYDYAHPGGVGTAKDREDFKNNFVENAGAYSVAGLADDATFNLLSLNTVLYANKKDDKGHLVLACVDNSTIPTPTILDCTDFRVKQNNFISNYIKQTMQDPQQRTLAIMHIPPYESGHGYDKDAQPALNPAFANQAYTIAGHWHMYSKLNSVNGVMQNSVTFRSVQTGLIVQPGFILYNFSNATISQAKHCSIADPRKLYGSAVDLNFSCQ